MMEMNNLTTYNMLRCIHAYQFLRPKTEQKTREMCIFKIDLLTKNQHGSAGSSIQNVFFRYMNGS